MQVEPTHPALSIRRQCELLGLTRSSFYYQPVEVEPAELEVMHALDRLYTSCPFYGSRRLAVELSRTLQRPINRKRIQRLMGVMGLEAVFPTRARPVRHPEHVVYPHPIAKINPSRSGGGSWMLTTGSVRTRSLSPLP